MPIIQYNPNTLRQRSTIFSDTGGYLSKVEKNAADELIRAIMYDAPINLIADIAAGVDIIPVSPASTPNLNLYFVGDIIALREEDGTAEPLTSSGEEFFTILAVDRVNLTITVDAVTTNAYTAASCVVYNTITSERYRTGFDKTLVTTDLWRNN